MIKFYKSGRPTKKEKGLLREIRNYLEQLPKEKVSSYSFMNERIESYERLEEIWNDLSSETVDLTEDFSSFNESTHKEVHTAQDLAEEITQQETEVIEEKPNNFESSSEETLEDINSEKEGLDEEISYEEQEGLVDKETGEIFNNTENESVKMEDAKILEELNKNSSSDEIPETFSPLDSQLKERSYNQGGDELDIEIPEPTFDNAPKAEDIAREAEQESKEAEQEAVKQQEEKREKPLDNVTNESMNDLSDKEKDEATEHLVETVLDTYDTLHVVGRQVFTISDIKLDKKTRKEGIPSNIMIPIDEEGNAASLKEVVEDVNTQIKEVLTPDPEFREKVKPPLKRIFAKKGWGMTDEQRVFGLIAQDFGTKAVSLFGIQQQLNTMIKNIGLMHREQNQAQEQAPVQPKSVQPDSIVTPPQQASPEPEPVSQEVETVYPEEDYQEEETQFAQDEQDMEIPVNFE